MLDQGKNQMGFKEPSEFFFIVGLFAILSLLTIPVTKFFSLHPVWGFVVPVIILAFWILTVKYFDRQHRRKTRD